MKKEELLKRINLLPDGVEICIYDYLANSEGDNDGEDTYWEGIYSKFDIGMMRKDDVMPKENRWAYISFTNPDYKEDGKVKMLERDIKEYEENE